MIVITPVIYTFSGNQLDRKYNLSLCLPTRYRKKLYLAVCVVKVVLVPHVCFSVCHREAFLWLHITSIHLSDKSKNSEYKTAVHEVYLCSVRVRVRILFILFYLCLLSQSSACLRLCTVYASYLFP